MPFFFDYHPYPYPLLFTYRTSYDVYNSVMVAPGILGTQLQLKTQLILQTWLLLETRLVFRTTNLDPRLVLETRLLFETRLLLEVLRYARYIFALFS